jgi:hypothetical protein
MNYDLADYTFYLQAEADALLDEALLDDIALEQEILYLLGML